MSKNVRSFLITWGFPPKEKTSVLKNKEKQKVKIFTWLFQKETVGIYEHNVIVNIYYIVKKIIRIKKEWNEWNTAVE